jgi:hypothetical protein
VPRITSSSVPLDRCSRPDRAAVVQLFSSSPPIQGCDCRSSNARVLRLPACFSWTAPVALASGPASTALCSLQTACDHLQSRHRRRHLVPSKSPPDTDTQRAATCDPACPSWSTITLGLPTLCCSPLTLRPVFGLSTPRPFRRLVHWAPRLGRCPPKLKDGCAPALPVDAVGAPRSNASTMASEPRAGRVSTEGRTASILLLRPLGRGVAKVAPRTDRTNSQTQTGGRNRAKVYKPITMELLLDWALSKALVPCWMRSILVS